LEAKGFEPGFKQSFQPCEAGATEVWAPANRALIVPPGSKKNAALYLLTPQAQRAEPRRSRSPRACYPLKSHFSAINYPSLQPWLTNHANGML